MAENGNKITADMTIGQVLRANPMTAEVFMKMGMHCLGCPSAQSETVGEAAQVHGIPVEDILQKLNSL